MSYLLAHRHVKHPISPEILTHSLLYLKFTYAQFMPVSGTCLNWPVCRLRSLFSLANIFMVVLQSTHSLWLLPAADHHNGITRLDSYGHVKPAITG